MTNSLQHLFEAIGQVNNTHELKSLLSPKIGEYFAARRSGVFLFEQLFADHSLQNVLKVALSIERNPVARYLAERHTPVHEGMVSSPKTWAIVCPRPDHWHVMAGPIVDRGQLVGVVGCTRDRTMPPFDDRNLADLSAICLHLSVWTATGRFSQNTRVPEPQHPQGISCLTRRELQIVELVALGHTNAEIGKTLWITENSVKQALKRMFRKLGVSSRAQMVARLYTSHPDPMPIPNLRNVGDEI